MKIWFRTWKDARLIFDYVVENTDEDTRTKKIFAAVDEVCHKYDLGRPVWLDMNIREFKRSSKTRFGRDNFVEEIDFDYMEISVLEED